MGAQNGSTSQHYDSGNGANQITENRFLLASTVNGNGTETLWRQYLAAFLASLISLSTGCVAGWSATATPKLQNSILSDLGIRSLSVDETSWVGSLINLGALVGSIPAGHLTFRLGRRGFLLLSAWPIIIGWLLIIFNQNNVWFLYIGRFISGLSCGSMNIALPIYNNEVCCDRIRGGVGTLLDLLQTFGLLYVYWFGASSSLLWTTIYCLLVPIVFIVTFFWMPESPLYLVRKGRNNEAVRSIKWLYGDTVDVNWQLNRIHQALLEGNGHSIIKSFGSKKYYDIRSPLALARDFIRSLTKVTIKATAIVFVIIFIQRGCGATIIQYYANSAFELAQSSIEPSYATVLMGFTSMIGSCVSIVVVDIIGRRFLLTFSTFVMSLSMAVFIAYLALVVENGDSSSFGLTPAITLCIFLIMFRLGLSPVSWFMAPEIIPTEAQKWAPSTIVCVTWGQLFVLSKCFLPAIEVFGQVPVYAFFLGVCVVGFFFTLAVVPETKNKSRQQIQRELGAPVSYDEI